MAREIGISNITLFKLTNETATAPTYDKANKISVPWAVNLETTEEYAESEYYADNVVERSSKILSKLSVSLELSSNTPPELDTKITGKTYIKGMAFNDSNAVQPVYALAYEIKMDDGNLRRRVIYKTTLARTGQTNETVSDSVTAQTFTYEGAAAALLKNGRFDMIMDKKEIDALSGSDKTTAIEAWNNFFTDVQGHSVIA